MATNEKVGNEIRQRLELGGFISALDWLVEMNDVLPETWTTWLESPAMRKMLNTGEIRVKDKGIGGLSSISCFASAMKELCRAIANTGKDEFLVLDTTISFFSKVGRMGQPFHWRTWLIGSNGMKSVELKKGENPFNALFYQVSQVVGQKKASEMFTGMLGKGRDEEDVAERKGKIIRFPAKNMKNQT